MMSMIKLFTLLAAVTFMNASVIAGPGHGSGSDAPAAQRGAASPRFTASSDLFEVVGILNTNALSVFVDRFDTNEPVTKANVEMEVNGIKKTGIFQPELGEFAFPIEAIGNTADTTIFAKPGSYAITLTITAGDDIDILAGNLVVPEKVDEHTHSIWTLKNAGIVAGGLVLLLIVFMLVKKSLPRRRPWGSNHA